MVGRMPRQVARLSSPSARLTSRVKPRSENSAPGLLTVLWITSSLPRSTSTSVTARLSTLRIEIAIKCPWLLLRAVSISASSSSRSDSESTGAATSIRSSNASARMVRGGAVFIGARRLASSAIVEQLDLLARKINSAVDEKIGHPAQGFDPACDGAMCESGLQFVEQIFGSGAGFRTHNSILERCGISDLRRFLLRRKWNWSDQAVVTRLRPPALAA